MINKMPPQRDIIIITGSSGFIGNFVAGKLAEHYTVLGFDRKPPKQSSSVAFLEVDIPRGKRSDQHYGSWDWYVI